MVYKIPRFILEQRVESKKDFVNHRIERYTNEGKHNILAKGLFKTDYFDIARMYAILGDKNEAESFFALTISECLKDIKSSEGASYVPFWILTAAILCSNDIDGNLKKLNEVINYSDKTSNYYWLHQYSSIRSILNKNEEEIRSSMNNLNKFASQQKWQSEAAPEFKMYLEGLISGNNEIMINGLKGIIKNDINRYNNGTYLDIPFSDFGIGLYFLARHNGIYLNLKEFLDEQELSMIPELYGGISAIDDETKIDENSPQKNEIIIEPLYGLKGEYFNAVFTKCMHKKGIIWNSHGVYANEVYSDDKYFLTKKIQTGELELLRTYKIIVQMKKKGNYLFITGYPVRNAEKWPPIQITRIQNIGIFIRVEKGIAKELARFEQNPEESAQDFEYRMKRIDPTTL